MKAGRRTLSLLAIVLAFGDFVNPAEPAVPRFRRGRPLTEALEELRARGLDIIYSSDLVRRPMRVLAEPVAGDLRGVLDDLIGPHGLVTSDGPEGRILIVAADTPAGPTGGVAGRVAIGADRRPAPGATITVPGSPAGAVAAVDGRFLIRRLPEGLHTLDVRSADGRMQQSIEVAVKAGDVVRVGIELTVSPTVVEGIVVTPTRYTMLAEDPETRRIIEGEELQRLSLLGDDAQRAVGRLPGAATADKSARVSLRGGEFNEVLVILDGLEIDQPYHLEQFFALSGIVDSRAVERVDLLTGGYPVEYGGRMGGVLEMMSSIPEDRGSGSIGAGIPNSRALIEGRTGADGVRWLAGARSWYPDTFVDLVDPGGEEINPYYYDLMGKVEYRAAGGTVISGHLLAARDLVDYSGEELVRTAKARDATTYAWLNVRSPWTPKIFSLTQISTGLRESDREGDVTDPDGAALVEDERVSRFFGARQDWIFRESDRALWKWGFDARDLDADYDYTSRITIADPLFTSPGSPILVDRRIRSKPSGLSLGAYGAFRARLHSALTAEAGLRWGRQSYARDGQVDPRINVVWTPSDRDTLRAAWGLFHQPQRIDELQVEDGVEEFFPAQLSEHRMIGFERDLGAGCRLRADVYWKEISNPRPRFENLLNPNELLPEAEPDRVRVAPRRATAKGIELFVRKDDARALSWWAGYTLAAAEDQIDGERVPRSWDQTHAVNLGLGLRLPPGWEIDLAGAWHTGWPATRVDARAVTDPNGMAAIEGRLGRRNAERYPPYHRLDLKVTRRIHLASGDIIALLEVLNLYDRENVCCVEDVDLSLTAGGEVRIDRRRGSWLGRIPSAAIRWEF